MRDVIDALVGVLAPHRCIGCGAYGDVLCTVCLENAGEPPAPRCCGCQRLMDGYRTCSACRKWLDIYAVYVSTAYSGMYELLLHEYKFRHRRQAAESIASIMLGMESYLPRTQLIVCPLPTAPQRVRQRGFDHADTITRTLLASVSPEFPYRYGQLLTRRSNVRQVGANRRSRIEQVSGEFIVRDSSRVDGQEVLIVDDVTTTGASLAAAAQALRQAGAKRVYALVYAQK